jgi:type I restriction enzyme S subunit
LFKVTSERYPKWFYYFWTLKFLDKFKQIAQAKATTMGHIKRSDLRSSLCVVPDDNDLANMDAIFSFIIDNYIVNAEQVQNLQLIRDLLLPRLISGKIRI